MTELEFKPSPDFERLRKVLLLEGEPDRVPLVELIVNQPVQEAFLGKPINYERLLRAASALRFLFTLGFSYLSRRFISDKMPAF